MSKLSLTSLGLVAGVIGMGIPSVGYVTRWLIQEKLKKSVSYREAVDCLNSHQEVKKLLGEPIETGRIDIGDNDSCGQRDNVKWFTIPVKGPLAVGKLRYWIVITNAEKNEFHVPKIELRLSDKDETSLMLKNVQNTTVNNVNKH